jgi:Arc/MetJ family transcription regulator
MHIGRLMRTNIDIDDGLMAKAMELSGHKTKRETVEAALELLVRLKSQEAIRAARGKLRWGGNLESMRLDQ